MRVLNQQYDIYLVALKWMVASLCCEMKYFMLTAIDSATSYGGHSNSSR